MTKRKQATQSHDIEYDVWSGRYNLRPVAAVQPPLGSDDGDVLTPAGLMAALTGDPVNAMAAVNPGGILAQEAKGAAAALKADKLPYDVGSMRAALDANMDTWMFIGQQTGFIVGSIVDDGLFIEVTMPEGWTKSTDEADPRHGTLRDPQGNVRATYFYKAAFYDRKADMSFHNRYSVVDKYDTENGRYAANANQRSCIVDNQNKQNVLFSTEFISIKDYAATDVARLVAIDWLKAQFPDHRNPFAYWNV